MEGSAFCSIEVEEVIGTKSSEI